MASLESQIQSAASLYESGRLNAAKKLLKACIARHPEGFDAFRMLGFIAGQQNDFKSAAQYLKIAVELRPTFVEGWYYLAKALTLLQRSKDALACLDKAIQLFPQFFEALHDRGLVLYTLRRFDEAAQSLYAACALQPNSPEAWMNLALALAAQHKFIKAIECYTRLLQLTPKNVEALKNLGLAYASNSQYAEAITAFEKVVAIDPGLEYARGYLLYLKLNVADWSNLNEETDLLQKDIDSGKACIDPFALTVISKSEKDQLTAAQLCASQFVQPALNAGKKGAEQGKIIRLAYLSADYHAHATAVLMMEIFKKHDRLKFHVIGISYGPDNRSDMRQELETAFDEFIDVRDKNDLETAMLIRDLKVDIAVDLKGYTRDMRPGILAYRPAPIQVNYLGYPGTMGADYIHYLIADRFVVPEDSERFYAEHIVVLPDSYQPNGKNRMAKKIALTREDVGLPESGFVFCSFNNTQKNNPDMLDIWTELLKQLPDSVLWMMSTSGLFETNILSEVKKRGIAPHRIIFAKRVPLEEHLARISLADLFLDSLPYGAHTTASDALWACVPVVTCVGTTFPGRVGQSVLQALEMPELITYSLTEYVDLALTLATNRDKLDAIRRKLALKIESAPLFQPDRYVAHLEWAYTEMHRRHNAAMSPEKIKVPNLFRADVGE
jgi:protein O-GlcNAc transferase